MAQKIKGGPFLSRLPRPALSRHTLRRLRRQGTALLLGALLAQASVSGGLRPFGVAYAAASGHPLAAAVGAFLSYLLYGAEGLVRGAAAIVTLSCRMVLEGTALSRRRAFFPACAAMALLFTRGVVALALGARAVLLLVCECLLCLGFARMLAEARDPRSPLALWGRLTAAMGAILAVLPVTLWGGLSPGRLAAVFLVLCAGSFGGPGVGVCVGLPLGACLDLTLDAGPFLALCWCMVGLCAGMGGKKDRLCAALTGCAACGLGCLWMSARPEASSALMECFLAAAALVLTPPRRLVRLETAFASAGTERLRRQPSGTGSLSGLSLAVAGLGSAMEALLRSNRSPAEPGEPGRVLRTACEAVCAGCKNRERCWQADYQEVQQALTALSGPLRRRHAVSPEELPDWFARRCLYPRQLCGAINDAYRAALRQQAQQEQARELRQLVGRQYRSLGALLESVSARAADHPEYDPLLEGRARRVVRAYLPRVKTAVCLNGGRLQLDLLLPPGDALPEGDHNAMLRSLEGALGMALLPPISIESRRGPALRIRQQEALALQAFTAVRKKAGESVCGDSHRLIHTDDGRAVLLLSDGMGTGAAAGAMSRRALELVEGFVRSGCPLAESTAAVLPVLAARFEEWGFVTLDLWEISLFTGRAAGVKYGAAPGFLLREGRLTRLDARALPAGLEPPEGEAPLIRLRLREGDRLVLLSDGVWDSGLTRDLLHEGQALPGQALADLLVEDAARRGGRDDMTVIVADLTLPERRA